MWGGGHPKNIVQYYAYISSRSFLYAANTFLSSASQQVKCYGYKKHTKAVNLSGLMKFFRKKLCKHL